MDQEILAKIEEQNKKLDAIYGAVDKMRKFFFWTLIISVAVIILPLIGLFFVLPQFLSSYTSVLQ